MSISIVKIDANSCIGCTKCLPVCPVDAIVGAQNQLHVVLTEFCIGCELCLPPCPVNCISLIPNAPKPPADITKKRVLLRKARINKIKETKKQADLQSTQLDMKSVIHAALLRASKKPKNMIWAEIENE